MMRELENHRPLRIGLVGDFDPTVPAHQAIPPALRNAAAALQVKVQFDWLPTEQITDEFRLTHFDGLWCVPASPYRNPQGAFLAIRYARENDLPFLGTCGGFQHALIEYARNVLAWADAGHAETDVDAVRQVIAPLQCALVEATGLIRIVPGTRLAEAYGCTEVTEGYRCRFGLNPEFAVALLQGALRVSAYDEHGEVRAVELSPHSFFVATLFQPERAALKSRRAPVVEAFVRACTGRPQNETTKPLAN